MSADYYLLSQLVFGIGFIIESIRHLGLSKHYKSIVGALLASLVGLLPGKHERGYDLHYHIWEVFGFYVFMLFTWNQRALIPTISEFSVMTQAIATWAYIFLLHPTIFSIDVTGVATIALLVTLLVTILPITLKRPIQIMLAVWHIVLSSVLLAYQTISFDQLAYPSAFTVEHSVGLLAAGALWFILGRNLTILYFLIPLPGKRQTFEDRWKQFNVLLVDIETNFHDAEMHPGFGAAFAIGVMILILANHMFEIVPTTSLLTTLVVLSSLIPQRFFGKQS